MQLSIFYSGQVAGEALKTNITTLGPLVLPASEQLLFFLVLVSHSRQCDSIFSEEPTK